MIGTLRMWGIVGIIGVALFNLLLDGESTLQVGVVFAVTIAIWEMLLRVSQTEGARVLWGRLSTLINELWRGLAGR